jgi:hypothetical protein
VIQAYRDLLIAFSKDVPGWASTTRAARSWMAANDADYPLYHLAAPEGKQTKSTPSFFLRFLAIF